MALAATAPAAVENEDAMDAMVPLKSGMGAESSGDEDTSDVCGPRVKQQDRLSHMPQVSKALIRRRASVARAQMAAESVGPAFWNGEEALREVASPDGRWDWALVGPDPSALPLVGGGSGGIEEMREAIGTQAVCFGMVRMSFGVEPRCRMKYVSIYAADLENTRFSARERGQAMGMAPQMEVAISKFATVSAKVQITSGDECTLFNIIEKLQSVAHGMDMDRELITMEQYEEAMKNFREAHPEVQKLEQQKERDEEHVDAIAVDLPRPEATEAEPDHMPKAAAAHEAATRLRKKVKVYGPGDVVEVFSAQQEKWMLDGEVIGVASETSEVEGRKIVAGSMKVEFSNGSKFEWIPPAEAEERLRPSLRPQPPLPVLGVLMKETHSWRAYWHKRYLEVSKGFLRWWENEAAAKRGENPRGIVYLLGLQQQREGPKITIRARNTKGHVYTFKSNTEQEAEEWADSLWAHAGFCQEVRDFVWARDGMTKVKSEIVSNIHSLHGGGQNISVAAKRRTVA